MSTPRRASLSAAPLGGHARILGMGAYRPERVVTNEDICQHIDSSDEWIRQRSGITQRYFAAAHETLVDMSEQASRVAIEQAGVETADIDAVLLATVTHPYQTPAAAPMLADRLGIPSPGAFDISAACAGYCYAIMVANDMVRSGSARHVLVVGVEKLSDFTDPADRGSAFIFGDGAGAAVVGPSDYPGIGPSLMGSDGAHWDKIAQREPWTNLREAMESPGRPDGIHWPSIGMQGQAVFRWAVYSMAPVARRILGESHVQASDLAAFVPHQANLRITDAMVKELALPSHVEVARDIVKTGNTSAASIPLAMTALLHEHPHLSGGLALQLGFGAGLAFAGQVVILP